jgi:hypothetical protein
VRLQLTLAAIGAYALTGLLLASMLGGCAPRETRTAHDDFRDTCAAASRAHLLAAEQAADGAISPGAFVSLDEAFDALALRCRAALTGETMAHE